MRGLICGIAAGLAIVALSGCRTNNPVAAAPGDNPALSIVSLSASPSTVPLGGTSLIECRVRSATGLPLKYSWTATGAVDYLFPMDSTCIFAAPSCHTGRATVTVVVSDDSGSTTGSVDLN
jgi:hypothetical protein